jgi:outer membrane protein TolC
VIGGRRAVAAGFVALVAWAGPFVASLAAQAAPPALSLDAFLARVVATHPVARQAEWTRRQVSAELRAARGGFDPAVVASWDLKRFNGVGYYDEVDARLTVPTPWGVDLKLGWDRAAGQIINPERKTPGAGLLAAGVSVPLGPRLVTDERRTALRQAELAEEAAEADRLGSLARLTQGAAREWGAWAEAEARARIADEGVALAAFRLEAVRRRVETGDAAAIDSVEALAEWERRRVAALEATAQRTAARLAVAGYLWRTDGAPDSLAAGVAPGETMAFMVPPGPAAVRRAVETHPAVAQARARFLQADAQRRLSAFSVLPTASVEVSSLAAGTSFGAVPTGGASDYKAAAAVRIPLLARRELGRLAATEARARQLALDRDRIRRDVELTAERARVELDAVTAQVAAQARVVAASEALLAAEQRRFDAGESSLLIVNLRERAVLDERLRAAQLLNRRAAAWGALVAALGAPDLAVDGSAARRAR